MREWLSWWSTTLPRSVSYTHLYGLWDILVTDSFDEYIDNLIIATDADIDVDDLLQEEFF